MVDINSTLNSTLQPLIQNPVVDLLGKIFGAVSIAVGGIFGLYLILIFLRWKEARDLKKILCDIRADIKDMKKFLKKKK